MGWCLIVKWTCNVLAKGVIELCLLIFKKLEQKLGIWEDWKKIQIKETKELIYSKKKE